MTGMRGVAGVLVIGLMLTGCGGGGEGTPAAETASPSSTPSPTPRNVESDACRQSMTTAGTIAAEMETGSLTPEQFSQMFDRLSVLRNRAQRQCSMDVQRPLARGLYQLARAQLWFTLCDIGSPCTSDKASRYLLNGTTTVQEAETIALLTS